MKKSIVILAMALVAQSCTTSKNTSVYYISGQKITCDNGEGEAQCFRAYEGDNLENPNWVNFDAPIEGFEFEEGVLQKVKIQKEEVNPKDVSTDASVIKYSLVEVLSKQKDYQVELTNNWILATINVNPINRMVMLPTLRIDAFKNQISGIDGCNNYHADITKLNPTKLELGAVASTKKMCQGESIVTEYYQALTKIRTYLLKEGKLVFNDENGKELLSYIVSNIPEQDYRLNDIWAVVSLNGEKLNKNEDRPRLEMNLKEMKVYGNDGCNEYSGEISVLKGNKLSFSKIGVTMRMCQEMEISSVFNAAISITNSYKLEGTTLIFYDENETETITFLKID